MEEIENIEDFEKQQQQKQQEKQEESSEVVKEEKVADKPTTSNIRPSARLISPIREDIKLRKSMKKSGRSGKNFLKTDSVCLISWTLVVIFICCVVELLLRIMNLIVWKLIVRGCFSIK